MRITLLYNDPLPSRYHSLGEGIAVGSVLESVDAISGVLTAAGHQVTRLALDPPLPEASSLGASLRGDLVFNLFEGFDGHPDTEWRLAQRLESLGLAFTGASAATLKLCLDKARCKERLAAKGIPTPPYQLLGSGNRRKLRLELPVIIKPLREDASHGLNHQSVASRPEDVWKQVSRIEESYGGPVMAEQYQPGREFSVSVLGGPGPKALPPTEIAYSRELPEPHFLTYQAKWAPEHQEYIASMPVCPAQVSEGLGAQLRDLALACHAAVGWPAYARVDFRCGRSGEPYVLEVNPNPDLSPAAGLALQAQAAGLQYPELIESIIERAHIPPGRMPPKFRSMQPGETEELVRITRDTGFFRADEVGVAREVLCEAAAKGGNSGYHVLVALGLDRLVGYICFGPAPMTKGTWDIYWMAVDPNFQGKGVGGGLMELAEQQIRRHQGRLAVLETSSQEMYEPTRRFYRSRFYEEVSRIKDFYDIGDDRITFAKTMGQNDIQTGPG